MIIKKTPAEIDAMARAGDVLVATLAELERHVRPGISTAELDRIAERFVRARGGVPTFKGYRGFPGSICASPNDMVVHGIPGPYRLKGGDIISIDVGVTLEGWVADAARTFAVGEISAQAHNLLAGTEASLLAARGPAGAQLWNAGQGPAARGGHGAGRRADDDRRKRGGARG